MFYNKHSTNHMLRVIIIEMGSRPQGSADRDAYRRGAPGSDKKADSGAGATAPGDIQFVSSVMLSITVVCL